MKAFLFPGQGSQSPNMGKEILEKFPEYKEILDIAGKSINVDLYEIIFGSQTDKLPLTENTQPCILTVSYIAYKYLTEKMKIVPDFVAGHSLGEWTALCAAEVLSFEDAVKMVRLRGMLMENACPAGVGGMAAVLGMEKVKILEVINTFEDLEIANYNTREQIVITGRLSSLEKAIPVLSEKGAKRVIALKVSGPFHSKLIEKASLEMKKALINIKFDVPKIPLIQNVTADIEFDPEKIKENMVRQIISPVRWFETIELLVAKGVDEFIESGFGGVLSGLMKSIDKNTDNKRIEKIIKEN